MVSRASLALPACQPETTWGSEGCIKSQPSQAQGLAGPLYQSRFTSSLQCMPPVDGSQGGSTSQMESDCLLGTEGWLLCASVWVCLPQASGLCSLLGAWRRKRKHTERTNKRRKETQQQARERGSWGKEEEKGQSKRRMDGAADTLSRALESQPAFINESGAGPVAHGLETTTQL